MYDQGHQHHHGVTKNIVEGIGGVIIGAAAVLLLTRLLKRDKTETRALPPAPAGGEVKASASETTAEELTESVAPPPAPKRPRRSRAKPKPSETSNEP